VGTLKDLVLDGLDIISPVPVGTVIREVEKYNDERQVDATELARDLGTAAISIATAGAGIVAAKAIRRLSEEKCFIRPRMDIEDFLGRLTGSVVAMDAPAPAVCQVPEELTWPLLFAGPLGAGAYLLFNEVCPDQELHRVFRSGEEVIRIPKRLVHGATGFLREYEIPMKKRELIEDVLMGPASLLFQ